jgi:hypothetical protein
MALIAGVRQAEPWNVGNIVGAVLLLAVVVVFLVWLIRRYLDS